HAEANLRAAGMDARAGRRAVQRRGAAPRVVRGAALDRADGIAGTPAHGNAAADVTAVRGGGPPSSPVASAARRPARTPAGAQVLCPKVIHRGQSRVWGRSGVWG